MSAPAMTSLLARFGVSYQNAPKPTPALLAFMRGLGMTLDTAADSNRVNKLRMNERANQTRAEISRQNDRSLTRLAGDQQSRGVLSSGETNTKVGRQAEDVARARGSVEQTLAEGIDGSTQAFQNTRDALRQQALEKTLTTETDLDRQKAQSQAQERSYTEQQKAADLAYTRQKAAQDAAYKAQETLFKKYQGV